MADRKSNEKMVEELVRSAISPLLERVVTKKLTQVIGEIIKAEREESGCIWEEHEGDYWVTACGNAFHFFDGGPEDNNAKYCIYCGGKIEPVELHERSE